MAGRVWTAEELDYLRENIGRVSLADMAGKLNRSVAAIISKTYDLGISHRLNMKDSAYREVAERRNAAKRALYHKRSDQGLCTMCGVRWAEAGQRMCRPCREWMRKWDRDNNMREQRLIINRNRKKARRENNLCVNCGKPLKPSEIGVNTYCTTCRKKTRERQHMYRIRDRVHHVPRKR